MNAMDQPAEREHRSLKNSCSQCETLVAAVSEMRHAQREYFRTKSTAALDRAKAAVKKVDSMLEDTQPRLFK